MSAHQPVDRPGAAPGGRGRGGTIRVRARRGCGKGHRHPVLDIGRGDPVARQLRPLPRPIRGISALERGEQGDGEQLEDHRGGKLAPSAGGTEVTESFELADTLPIRLYWMLAGPARRRANLDGMRVTLERIKAVTESADPSH